MTFRLLIFLMINFAALGVGGLFTSKGVPSDWYIGLNKAPWTPPGWVFGIAWASIMIFFTIYMAILWPLAENTNLLIGLFLLQLILNIAWNPVFFHFHHVALGLVLISGLTILIGFLLIYYYPQLQAKSLLLAPYFLWLLIATSLNAYILIKN